ncbi:MAG: L-aspartate oxidase [Deltaproteobacteria bacterium RIFCSPLOWO2_12_FULL_40_28]|nr:MAG: L-aspartate oxidase [Deltaproteobacteria bacterium RIFCSPHIGHO2_02_FULL_40_28]OGQ20858.1 MAG: L-aspartate oxidase [Deltaproteobacteria bacterium RIFCSPHIGHO2_12_FULL_40_32]OGQ39259.1 MAG: L-aspartate oxidase [Deltaproteobacteria bacterium RIFCSPLOWO2_02_FULL_40_36]OGQ54540.1 MAG: L-aspartate oxidase [Deltaproteobacteria bacterium RIFCSPLOWO2_12_FULL_40_28]
MVFKTDAIIVGSGIAGLSLALKLSQKLDVLILTKKEVLEANTRYAQGGIASVTSIEDDFSSHVKDTLEAGAGLCKKEVVEKIIGQGPRLIKELVALGVTFSKNQKKEFDLGREGGHSHRRVLHAGDTTGNAIVEVLLDQVLKNAKIKVLEYHVGIDLILDSKTGHCHGIYALDTKTSQIHSYFSKILILASGGAGKIYLYTTNPDVATGDGIGMAYRAGAKLSNLEFVQFHPTSLYNPHGWTKLSSDSSQKIFLISEALRGEGGILKLISGAPFMQNYHPMKDLAPRDIVARAIDCEMKKSGDDYVLLDITHRDPDFIKKRFPHIYEVCLKFGYNITSSPIPVVPAAHYFCGGIACNVMGESSIPGLYAIGETASTGLHGANRLASNSLLEALAMADFAAHDILEKWDIFPEATFFPEWQERGASDLQEAVVISQNWDEIRRLLWNYVGIVRSNKRLLLAQKRIQLFLEEINQYYWDYRLTKDLIELRNVALCASLVIECALKRKESRGLHYTVDYPQSKIEECHDTIIKK